jgi:hypothetical protein
VELLELGENVVGTGVINENIKCGMELNVVKLCPFEVAVRVMEVRDGSVQIGEIVGERLGQCIGLVIWWKRSLLRNLEGRRVSLGESNEGQNFSFPTLVVPKYDFDEEETFVGHEEGPPLLGIAALPETHLERMKVHIPIYGILQFRMVCRLRGREEDIRCITIREGQRQQVRGGRL